MSSPGSSSRGTVGKRSRAGSKDERLLRQSSFDESAASARDEAADAAETLSASAKEAVRTTTKAVKEQASAFATEFGYELTATAEEQKQRGVEAIRGFLHAANTAAAELEQQSPHIAGYTPAVAAETLKNVGEKIATVVNQTSEAAGTEARNLAGTPTDR